MSSLLPVLRTTLLVRATDHKAHRSTDQSSVPSATIRHQSISQLPTCSTPEPTYLAPPFSTHVFDTPDFGSFYDSGLVIMPALWAILSIMMITLMYFLSGTLDIFSSSYPPPFLASEALIIPLMSSLPAASTMLSCFFCRFISILFSFLISITGSQAEKQHRRLRRAFQVSVALLLLLVPYIILLISRLFSFGEVWYAYTAIVSLYILLCSFLVGYQLMKDRSP